jgi:hypothetical protein
MKKPKSRLTSTGTSYELLMDFNLSAIHQIAIDDTWSALRFKVTD